MAQWLSQCDKVLRERMLASAWPGFDSFSTFIVSQQTYRNTVHLKLPGRLMMMLDSRLHSSPDLAILIRGRECDEHFIDHLCQFFKSPKRSGSLCVNGDTYARAALHFVKDVKHNLLPRLTPKDTCEDIFTESNLRGLEDRLEKCSWGDIFRMEDLVYMSYLLRDAKWCQQLNHTLRLFALYHVPTERNVPDQGGEGRYILDYLRVCFVLHFLAKEH
ncbi:hypothetical protein B0H34DRAFT_391849 [Crassisporium funariophilum]|nr:hypothetical protein B0H34DRAFT_391849 [Crassisporium funariophilum]